MAFEQVGGADTCLAMAKDYAVSRYAFGRPIGSYQAIKHKLADMYVNTELARSNAYFGAWALSTNARELPLAAAAARVSATQAFDYAAKESTQTHGGIGYTWEMDCHLFYKRSRELGLRSARSAAGKTSSSPSSNFRTPLEPPYRQSEGLTTMDFEDTAEEAKFRSEVRRWLDENAKGTRRRRATRWPNAADKDFLARASAWQAKKAKAGYARITWPKEVGGYRRHAHPASHLQPGRGQVERRRSRRSVRASVSACASRR